MSKVTPLIDALRHLAAAAPREYTEFRAAAAAFSNEQTTALVTSAPDELSRMQGRAQVAALFASMVENAKNGA